MSTEETKPTSVPVESAANEIDDAKKLEGSIDVVPSAASNGKEKSTNGAASVDATEPTASTSAAPSEEAPKLSDSEIEDQVVQDAVKQISFYFSDSNLPYDKFLFFQAQDGNKDPEAPMGTGWVSLSTVLSFKRMQEIIARSSRSATISEFAVVNALRAAYPSSDENALIEISSDGNDIRRKQPLREPGKTDQMSRSVYVKGFPEEEQKSSGDRNDRGGYVSSQLQKDLERWFESLGLGKVNAVRMRRDDQKHFKQSVFVEFATIESAKALVELDPKPTYKGQTEPVEVMFKKDYIDMKAKEKGIAPQYQTGRPTNAPANNNAKRPFNAFKDYKREDNKPKQVTVYVEGKEMDVDSETGKLKNPEDLSFTSGKILKFEVTEGSDEFNPYHLKQALNPVHAAAFVESERGSSSGVVFFKEPVTEEILQKIKETDLKLGSAESKIACTWTLLEGDEEKKYHLDRANKRASIALADSKAEGGDRRDNDRRGGDRRGGGRDQRGGRGRGGGRGGRGGNRGGRGGHRDNRDGGRSDDRNRENARKRNRDDDNNSPVKQESRGNSISIPVADSTGPSAPPAKKVKQED